MQTTQCPKCNSDIIVEDELNRGDLVNCLICGEELEIASLHPLLIKSLEEPTTEKTSNQ